MEVTFKGLSDPNERQGFLDLPTSFNLPDADVDRLREVGEADSLQPPGISEIGAGPRRENPRVARNTRGLPAIVLSQQDHPDSIAICRQSTTQKKSPQEFVTKPM